MNRFRDGEQVILLDFRCLRMEDDPGYNVDMVKNIGNTCTILYKFKNDCSGRTTYRVEFEDGTKCSVENSWIERAKPMKPSKALDAFFAEWGDTSE